MFDRTNPDHMVVALLYDVWDGAISTKSDRARYFADVFASAASQGFITTQLRPGSGLYGTAWRLAPGGLIHLFQHSSILGTETLVNGTDRAD